MSLNIVILNVSSDYVRRRLVFEQRLPYIKVGRHLRIDETDLRAFMDSGRVSPAQYKDLLAERERGVSRGTRRGKTWPVSGN